MGSISTGPTVRGGAQASLVAIVVSVGVALLIFLVTNSYLAVLGRIDRLEASQQAQNEAIAALRVQIDTVNTRGTQGADARLNTLEAQVAVNGGRLARLEQVVYGK